MEVAAASLCSMEAAKAVLGKIEREARFRGKRTVAAVQFLPGSSIRVVLPGRVVGAWPNPTVSQCGADA